MHTVTGIKRTAEPDGSHILELTDGQAVIPAGQQQEILTVLQQAVVERVFAQSQKLDRPTESTLPLREFRVQGTAAASLGTATNLACNLHEFGWVALLADESMLRKMRQVIDDVLTSRAAPRARN